MSQSGHVAAVVVVGLPPTRPQDGRGSVSVSSFRRPRAEAAVTGIPPTAAEQPDAAHARTRQPVPPCLDLQHELCQ
jgi:hypothetical protein